MIMHDCGTFFKICSSTVVLLVLDRSWVGLVFTLLLIFLLLNLLGLRRHHVRHPRFIVLSVKTKDYNGEIMMDKRKGRLNYHV